MTRGVKSTIQTYRGLTMVDRGSNPSDPKNDKNFIILIFTLGIRCKMVNTEFSKTFFSSKTSFLKKMHVFLTKIVISAKIRIEQKFVFSRKIVFFIKNFVQN